MVNEKSKFFAINLKYSDVRLDISCNNGNVLFGIECSIRTKNYKPTLEYILRFCSYTDRTLKKHIKFLQDKSYIPITNGRYKINYDLMIKELELKRKNKKEELSLCGQ